MPLKTQQYEIGKLERENRRLRDALDALLAEIETSNAQVDVTKAREKMPTKPGERAPITPPGQRGGSPGQSGSGGRP